MSFRPSADPLGGNVPLVDKMIGTAYDTVLLVSRNLQMLAYLATHMDTLFKVATDIKSNTTVFGVAGAPGQTTSIAMPTQVNPDLITSSMVMLDDGEGGLYPADSGYFMAHIKGRELKLTLTMQAPAELQGVSVRWFLTYGM